MIQSENETSMRTILTGMNIYEEENKDYKLIKIIIIVATIILIIVLVRKILNNKKRYLYRFPTKRTLP